jgi:hypothetical protein
MRETKDMLSNLGPSTLTKHRGRPRLSRSKPPGFAETDDSVVFERQPEALTRTAAI